MAANGLRVEVSADGKELLVLLTDSDFLRPIRRYPLTDIADLADMLAAVADSTAAPTASSGLTTE